LVGYKKWGEVFFCHNPIASCTYLQILNGTHLVLCQILYTEYVCYKGD
jgi:hypothetical protein